MHTAGLARLWTSATWEFLKCGASDATCRMCKMHLKTPTLKHLPPSSSVTKSATLIYSSKTGFGKMEEGVEEYFHVRMQSHMDNPLLWWKSVGTAKYPSLSRVARLYPSVPATLSVHWKAIFHHRECCHSKKKAPSQEESMWNSWCCCTETCARKTGCTCA